MECTILNDGKGKARIEFI